MSAAAHGKGKRGKGGAGGHEGADERWMVTYADMLTLLFVLFVVLYSMSAVNTSKFKELKSSLASAFNNGQASVLSGGSGIVGGESLATQASTTAAIRPATALSTAQKAAATSELNQFKKITAAITKALHDKSLDGKALFSVDARGLVVTVVTDALVFAGNSATLEGEGARIIDAAAPELGKIDNQLQVNGHTNQLAVSTAPYPSGWELSSARASSVVRHLIASDGISASRLSAAGYSDQRPLLPASDPRAAVRNRRVDIVIASKLPPATRVALPDLAAAAGVKLSN